MKILIHSNAPWVPSGYGTQCAQMLFRLRAMGHDVAVSAFYGLSGAPIKWKSFPIYPAGQANYGVDVVKAHAQHFGADLVLTLMDFWQMLPVADQLTDLKVAAWIPNDCAPLSKADEWALKRSRAVPIAMSKWGLSNLHVAGFGDALYAPHGIDTEVFAPPEDAREELREDLGVKDRFVIGICAANKDAVRKAFPEQLSAFAKFHLKHPEALLLMHTLHAGQGGYDLMGMADDFGIPDEAIRFSDPYEQIGGHMKPETMAAWYGCLDVLSNCSYGEGFGLPIIEAQACGTPVVVTNTSAMTELGRVGWKVPGQPFWNAVHRGWWVRPNVDDIVKAYEKAYRELTRTDGMRATAREFALAYDADRVAQEHWQPLLEQLEES